MLEWLHANWSTLAAALVVAAIVAAAVVKIIRDKRRNRGCCGCSCAGCPGASLCHREKAPLERSER